MRHTIEWILIATLIIAWGLSVRKASAEERHIYCQAIPNYYLRPNEPQRATCLAFNDKGDVVVDKNGEPLRAFIKLAPVKKAGEY